MNDFGMSVVLIYGDSIISVVSSDVDKIKKAELYHNEMLLLAPR
jgi:hypothetical protein